MMEEDVKKLFFEVFPILTENDFDWNKKQEEYPNWDSFAHLQLITMAEEKFNITLTLEEATTIKSAKDLLTHIKSHL